MARLSRSSVPGRGTFSRDRTGLPSAEDRPDLERRPLFGPRKGDLLSRSGRSGEPRSSLCSREEPDSRLRTRAACCRERAGALSPGDRSSPETSPIVSRDKMGPWSRGVPSALELGSPFSRHGIALLSRAARSSLERSPIVSRGQVGLLSTRDRSSLERSPIGSGPEPALLSRGARSSLAPSPARPRFDRRPRSNGRCSGRCSTQTSSTLAFGREKSSRAKIGSTACSVPARGRKTVIGASLAGAVALAALVGGVAFLKRGPARAGEAQAAASHPPSDPLEVAAAPTGSGAGASEAPPQAGSRPSAPSPSANRAVASVVAAPSAVASSSSSSPAVAHSTGALASPARPAHGVPGVRVVAPPAGLAAAPGAPKASCNPPYVIDAAGDRQYKPECL